ncbi:MAG: hypothetical protein HY683_02925 [Chloroflexi bacterium]|nr:hypothetical protein [Chloroflexota bacterium]
MTSDELAELIKAQGLYPIPVEGDANKFDEPVFAGSLDNYFAAVKVLGAKAILVYTNKLEEADFVYESDIDDEDGVWPDEEMSGPLEPVRSVKQEWTPTATTPAAAIDSVEREVDLAAMNPSLAKFKRRIGSEYAFRLTAVSEPSNLDLRIQEEWWHDFKAEKDKAIHKVREARLAELEKTAEIESTKARQLLRLVEELINDPKFVVIPTQRSMKRYALEKYPELASVADQMLTREIQLVSDRIKAKGLNKRGR